jgi:hypothetical protein
LYVTTPPEAVSLTPGVIALGIAVGRSFSRLRAAAVAGSRAREADRDDPPRVAAAHRASAIPRRSRRALLHRRRADVAPATIRGIAVAGYITVLFVVAGSRCSRPRSCARPRASSRRCSSARSASSDVSSGLAPASLRRVRRERGAIARDRHDGRGRADGRRFRETVRIWVDQTVSSDLWLRPAKGLSNAQVALFPAEVGDAAARLPFVEDIDRVRGKDVVYGDTIIAVGGAEFDVAAERGLPMVTPRSARVALRTRFVRTASSCPSFALKFDKRVGDHIDLARMRLPITGIYRDYSNDRGVVVMDRSLFIRTFGDDSINTIVVFLQPGVTTDQARRMLERDFGQSTTRSSLRMPR